MDKKKGSSEIEINFPGKSFDGSIKIDGIEVPGTRDIEIFIPLEGIPTVKINVLGHIAGKLKAKVNIQETILVDAKGNEIKRTI